MAIPHTVCGFSFFPCEVTLHARQGVFSYLLFLRFMLPIQTIFVLSVEFCIYICTLKQFRCTSEFLHVKHLWDGGSSVSWGLG